MKIEDALFPSLKHIPRSKYAVFVTRVYA